MVADPAAERLYVYRLPELEPVAEFSGIRMATHPGFLPLQGDRVLFVHEAASDHEHDGEEGGNDSAPGDDTGDHAHNGDGHDEDGDDHAHTDEGHDGGESDHGEDAHEDGDHSHGETKAQHEHDNGHDHDENGKDEPSGELVVLHLNLNGKPAIIGRAPTGAPTSHIAVHPDMTYAVVGSADPERALNIVDLRWWSHSLYETFASLPLSSLDPGVAFGKNPTVVYHRFIAPSFTAGRLEAYPLVHVLKGTTDVTTAVELGGFPHGELISHPLRRFCSLTDRGLECADTVADTLVPRRIIPYDTPERVGGRAFYGHLSTDGRRFFSHVQVQEDLSSPLPWPEWHNDAYLVDLTTEATTRVELGRGWAYRFSYSDTFALYYTTHPDGDTAYLLDTNPKSPTFRQVVARLPLDPLRYPLNPDVSPYDPAQDGQDRTTASRPTAAGGSSPTGVTG